MGIDESFKKPGAVPFSWEVRPGVPKTRPENHYNQKQPPPPLSLKIPPPQLQPPSSPFIAKSRSLSPLTPPLTPPLRLKPPPISGFFSPEPRTRSFRSAPRVRSDRWRFEQPNRVPERVGPGCFPSPLIRLKKSSKRWTEKKTRAGSESEYVSDLETMSPWSVSSRRSVSPMWDSPKSSFSSNRFSPRFTGEAEWVGYGLF